MRNEVTEGRRVRDSQTFITLFSGSISIKIGLTNLCFKANILLQIDLNFLNCVNMNFKFIIFVSKKNRKYDTVLTLQMEAAYSAEVVCSQDKGAVSNTVELDLGSCLIYCGASGVLCSEA